MPVGNIPGAFACRLLSGLAFMDMSVVICTHNRADSLQQTLAALAALQASGPWETVLVDNASTGGTRRVVEDAAPRFPVPLRYVYEPDPGKYGALNTGIAMPEDASSLRPTMTPSLTRGGCAKLRPDSRNCRVNMSAVPCARCGWDSDRRGYPSAALSTGRCSHFRIMAATRANTASASDGHSASTWRTNARYSSAWVLRQSPGRIAGTLPNQFQREWHLRARSVGVRGFYLPDMLVHHIVVAERLTKNYFRRWFYWHGRSRAILSHHTGLDIEEPETARAAGGGPPRSAARGLFGKAFRSTISCLHRRLQRQDAEAFEYKALAMVPCWRRSGVLGSAQHPTTRPRHP